jgi:hypothetical protein
MGNVKKYQFVVYVRLTDWQKNLNDIKKNTETSVVDSNFVGP